MAITITNRFTDDTIYTSQTASTIREAVEEAVKAKVSLHRADLTGADLSGANLYGADLRRADLHDANLSGANLSGADLSGANLSGANLSGADLRDAYLSGADITDITDIVYVAPVPQIPQIPQIHQTVLRAMTAKGCGLNMNDWHTCKTTHCRAGWVVHLAGKAGRKLEKKVGTSLAAVLIYRASDPTMRKVPDFYCEKSEAVKSIRAAARRERTRAKTSNRSSRPTVTRKRP